jgi:hypothetical protein
MVSTVGLRYVGKPEMILGSVKNVSKQYLPIIQITQTITP